MLDCLEKPLVAALLEPLLHSPVTHVRKILHPLEVRDRHAARIRIDVWKKKNIASKQLLARIRGDRTVRTFDDDLCLDAIDVRSGDLVLQRRRHEHIAIELESVSSLCKILRARESKQRPGFLSVRDHLVYIET